MEFNSANILHDTHDVRKKNDNLEPAQPEAAVEESCSKVHKQEDDEDMESGDVNMEAFVSADDVMKAGGFGARDDISNFLPVASDSTDFEASLRDARDYEEPQKDVSRPGLGWKDDVKEQD